MTYKNIKQVLVDAAKFPAAIEAKLPNGAPKISTTLADIAGKIPVVPDFPVEIPSMPAPPKLPELPGESGLRRRFVTEVVVTPVESTKTEIVSSPAAGVIPVVITRRGL